jgi:hypothetical protein
MTGPPAARLSRFLSSSALSGVVAVLFLMTLVPMLARAPQNGDGAEVVAAALHGGVMHPPGFPLLAWLARGVVRLPVGTPVERIAFLNAVCHAATLFVLLEILRAMKVRRLPSLVAGLAYATFPSLWYLGTQTEVFSLAYLLMALATWLAVVSTGHGRRRDSVLVGVVTGLGLAQHPIFVTGLASFAVPLWQSWRIERRFLSPAVWRPVVVASLIVSAAYLSLLALHRPGCWPDWGHLHAVSDVVRHATRAEYGAMGLTSLEGETYVRGLAWAAANLLRHWNILLIALLFAPRRGAARLLWVNAALACIFLFVAKVPQHRALSAGVLERFEGTLLVPSAVLLGLGLARSKRLLVEVGALAVVLVGAVLGYGSANSRSDDTSRVYRNTLAASLPANAVYLGLQDLEVFSGLPTSSDEIRFPISPELYGLPWYREHVAARLEPRLRGQDNLPSGSLIEWAVQAGLEVYATDPDVFAMAPFNYRREGLFLVASGTPSRHSPAEMATRMRLLCQFARQLSSLPPQGHHGSRLLYFEYADALEKYAQELVAASGPAKSRQDVAEQSRRAARALWDATDAPCWRQPCEAILATGAGAP